jgi:sulfoacetaldehyde acetyltransferase
MIIFRNYQWGAEKRNTTLWYEDNFRGNRTGHQNVSYAGIAKACGMQGVQVMTPGGSDRAVERMAVRAQMEEGKTTFIEVFNNKELGEPFRRDAMKKPVVVAGIDPADMRPQPGAV